MTHPLDRWLTITDTEYSAIDAVRSSQISAADKRSWYHASQPRADNPAFRVGRAIHCAILEPLTFSDRFVVMPEFDARTKAGKAVRDEWLIKSEMVHHDVDTLTAAEHEMVMRLSNIITDHDEAQDHLWPAIEAGQVEQSVIWDDPTGVRCKARLDAWHTDTIADVKSTSDASPEAFDRAVRDYRYHISAAHYRTGAADLIDPLGEYERIRFVLIAVEKTAQSCDEVAIYDLSEHYLQIGGAVRHRLLCDYADIKAGLQDAGYPRHTQTLEPPEWLARRYTNGHR